MFAFVWGLGYIALEMATLRSLVQTPNPVPKPHALHLQVHIWGLLCIEYWAWDVTFAFVWGLGCIALEMATLRSLVSIPNPVP